MAAELIKKFSLIKPRSGMGHAGFLHYGRMQHGPLVVEEVEFQA